MADETPRARQPIPCPECAALMEPGWVRLHAGLDGGPAELRWTDRDPVEAPGRVRFRDGRGVLDGQEIRWACWCDHCRNLFMRTEVSPTDEPDAEYAWTGIQCLNCRRTIPAEEERCSACGWTYGLDGPAPGGSA